MKEILKAKGYKATRARLNILEVFSKSKTPLDAKAVYKKIKNQKNINEATVYRTLASLGKAGILRKVDLRKDSVYFELERGHHHHIICTECDTIEDFQNTEIEKAIEKVWGRIVGKSSKFKSIKEHSLELFGLCRMCA